MLRNLVGEKFNKWVVIEKRKYCQWFCRCECGNTSIIKNSDLVKNKSKQCRECAGKETSKRLAKDLTGMKFGNWIVIERVGTNKYRRPLWKCQCSCGKIGVVPSGNLLTGLSTKCRKCNQYKGITGRTWTSFLNCAKIRNIPVFVTIEDLWELYEKQDGKCALTGQPIYFAENSDDYNTASLDRINCTLPYTIDNIQWVHKTINRMKWVLQNEDFIEYCRSVVKFIDSGEPLNTKKFEENFFLERNHNKNKKYKI